MTVTVVMAVALSLSVAADPSAESRSPKLQFELVDGTVITGRTDVKAITIRIASGNVLKISVADLTELTVGLKNRSKRQSKLRAGETTLLGTVTVGQFLIASPYGRFTVKLDDVRRIRSGFRAAPRQLGPRVIDLHDRTRLKGIVVSKTLRILTHYGTAVVPLARIQKATFAADGKSIHAQCWGSDRIVGVLGPETTISVKTDKGRVDLSAGKIAIMSYRPLTLKSHSDGVTFIAFSPDGKRLASGSHDKTIKIWDTAGGNELLTLKGHSNWVMSVAFSPDGKRLASGSWDETIKIWDTVTGKELLTLKGSSGLVNSVVFSPDGKHLASGSLSAINIWDTTTGKKLLTLEGHWKPAWFVAFSPDGKRLASGSGDKTIKLWDTVTGKGLLTLKGHSRDVFPVAFSPDGKRLASGSGDKTIKLWDTVTGKELLTLKGHSYKVYSVAFSLDGKHLASTAGDDSIIKLWDTITGKELLTITGHSGFVNSVAFSPDGKRLASGSDDKTIKIWDTFDWPKSQK